MSDAEEFAGLVTGAERTHLDARVLAYHLVAREPEVALTRRLFRGIRDGEVRAQTSSMTLYQLLSEPYRRGEADLASEAEKMLTGLRGLELVPVSASLSGQAARVRARLGADAATSVQIATAVTEGADLFLTDGSGLRRVAGVRVRNLSDFV